MEWSDIKAVVTKLAPTIATGLGGPLAGTAVAALEGVFGAQVGDTTADKQSSLVAAISGATPDQLLALKKADQDYAAKMAELGFKNTSDLETIASNDRDSARKREESVKDHTPRLLACVITLGFFASLGVLMFGSIPAASRDILNIMLGTLGTAWIAVVTYYYGSTAGSSEKTRLLAASTPVETKK